MQEYVQRMFRSLTAVLSSAPALATPVDSGQVPTAARSAGQGRPVIECSITDNVFMETHNTHHSALYCRVCHFPVYHSVSLLSCQSKAVPACFVFENCSYLLLLCSLISVKWLSGQHPSGVRAMRSSETCSPCSAKQSDTIHRLYLLHCFCQDHQRVRTLHQRTQTQTCSSVSVLNASKAARSCN